MHKCVNNTIGNVYHLEQWVDNFFPYSQKQLRFDQPVSIVFQSDEENASRMLGKTAYYDPESMQVVLYTDNRHPKDVMRSLSHELVHHAQNCRGDFTGQDNTAAGYAQNDLHLRKMEREAYTKGNLIFRDFEDLIKTGKFNIEIDFSDSGEPKMSLKEWKNNEINTKLMKKWGLLKEEKNEPADVAKADDELAGEEAGEDAAEELEESEIYPRGLSDLKVAQIAGWQKRRADNEAAEKERIAAGGEPKPPSKFTQRARANYQAKLKAKKELGEGCGDRDDDDELEEGWGWRKEDDKDLEEGGADYRDDDELEEGAWSGAGRLQQTAADEDDPTDPPETWGLGNVGPDEKEGAQDVQGGRVSLPRSQRLGKKSRPATPGSRNVFTTESQASGKISVREAKQITRRIIERIKKESK